MKKTLISLLALIIFISVAAPVNGAGVTVTTKSATAITDDDAILVGSVFAAGQFVRVWFEWGTDSKLTNFSFAQEITGTSPVSFQTVIYDLKPQTTYDYRAVVKSASGIQYGEIKSFTTEDAEFRFRQLHRPDVRTEPTTDVSYNWASLKGLLVLNGLNDPRRDPNNTEVWFEWGTDPDSLSETTHHQVLREVAVPTVFGATLSNLEFGKTYFYRAVAENFADTSYGDIMEFTTDESPPTKLLYPPSVKTLSATLISADSVILKGKVSPNNATTTAWFEWGTTPGLGNKATPITIGPRGTFDISSPLTNLQVNTQYYYRVVAINESGRTASSINGFRTSFSPTGITVSSSQGGQGEQGISKATTGEEVKIFSPFSLVKTALAKLIFGEEEPAVTLTLESLDTKPDRRGTLRYLISYRNGTDRLLRNAVIEVSLPDELKYLDSSIEPDSVANNRIITFDLAKVASDEKGEIKIETRAAEELKAGDQIRMTANLKYLDRDVKNSITAVEMTEISKEDLGEKGLEALAVGGFGGFLGNPIFRLLVVLIALYLLYRFVTFRAAIRRVGGGSIAPPSDLSYPPTTEPPVPLTSTYQPAVIPPPPLPPRPPSPPPSPPLPPRPPEPPPFG